MEQEAQVIEVVRWRQPICVIPAQGVQPCFDSLRSFQNEYERLSSKGFEQEIRAPWEMTNLRSSISTGDKEVITRLISSEIVTTAPLSAIQPSASSENPEELSTKTLEVHLKTPELTTDQERSFRNSRSLPTKDVPTKPPQIYVTKVLNSPVTATLVAHNCLPDVGLPLCENYQPNIEPPKPVFDSRPSLGISVEAERPVLQQGTQGGIWEDHFVDNPQTSGFNIPTVETDHQLPQNLKPQIIIRKPTFDHSAASFAYGGSSSTQMAPGLLHVVTTGSSSHTVTDLNRRPGIVSSSVPSKFSFVEIPEELTPDRSIKTELSLELAKDSGNEATDASNTRESSISNQRNKQHLLQIIHDIVNKTEQSAIVQGIQKLLHKSSQGVLQHVETTATSTGGSAILGNIFKPASLFHSQKTLGTKNPEALKGVGGDKEELVEQPSFETEETSTFMDILHKPENDISNIPGLLDVFGQLQDKGDSESLAEPTEKPGLFGDMFANPVRPFLKIEARRVRRDLD